MKIISIVFLMSLNLMAFTAYQTNSDGTYAGPVECQKDPKAGGYLIPGGATLISPPTTSTKKVAVFNGISWVVKDNYVGEKYWNKTTVEMITISSYGTIPDLANYTSKDPKNYKYPVWNSTKDDWENDKDKDDKDTYRIKINKILAKRQLESIKDDKDLSQKEKDEILIIISEITY